MVYKLQHWFRFRLVTLRAIIFLFGISSLSSYAFALEEFKSDQSFMIDSLFDLKSFDSKTDPFNENALELFKKEINASQRNLASDIKSDNKKNIKIPLAKQYIQASSDLFQKKKYFEAAKFAFSAVQLAESSDLKSEAYAWVTVSLIRAGMPHSASYFFIRTLQMGHRHSIRAIVSYTEELLIQLGPDLIRKYLTKHTRAEDYGSKDLNSYFYVMAKEALFESQELKAIEYINKMSSQTPLLALGQQLRGTAYAIQGKNHEAIRDFKACVDQSDQMMNYYKKWDTRQKFAQLQSEELAARCIASEARTYYQMKNFDQAEKTYDKVEKKTWAWPEILFEQAWNAFSKQEYNKTLGKLVSYKSPALQFVFNTEIDVLRAQSFSALCLYEDTNQIINEFHKKYTPVAEEVKSLLKTDERNLNHFYRLGKTALKEPLSSPNMLNRLMNRFVRSPYFQNFYVSENEIAREIKLAKEGSSSTKGLAGFLQHVLSWRLESVSRLGGAFVKNSLIDYYSTILNDFEKISFIKLEMLKMSKTQILAKNIDSSTRSRGNIIPSRKGNQLFWDFNGEYWNDELGAYVFGLESACH